MKTPLLAVLLVASTAVGASATSRQDDLDFVANRVPQLHANFFFQFDPALYRQAAANIAANLDTLTDAEFYVQLTALIAMAGDPHTAIYLNGSAAAAAGFRQFPLILRWLDDGVFVTGAAAPYTRALGAQLVGVGGMPIAQVVAQLATLIPHVNDQWVQYMAEKYLLGQQILQGLHVVPVAPATSLTFRTLAGEVFTLDVSPGSNSSLSSLPDSAAGIYPDYLQNTSQNYWFTYSAANRLLYFKYNSCGDMPGNPFANFANQVLATVDANPVDTFVFDLRGNTGGNSAVWNPLINGLTARLAALLSNPQFHMYGVIDNGTFSSGSLDAMTLKQPLLRGLVQVLGEPTGGATQGYGNVTGFTLPSSGLVGQYSTQFITGPSYVPAGPAFQPDIAISVRSTDFFARHDHVMAAILARTDAVPPPPSGSAIAVNGASFRADQGLAPGSFASVFGSYSQVPDQVLVAGIPGRVVAATASQVNFLVPALAPLGPAAISVRANGSELASGQATITSSGPGIFVLRPDPSQPGAVENQDASMNTSSSPADAGSIVQIYATGNGPVDASGNAPVSVFFGDLPADVLASVPLTQYPGLWQINVRVPAGITGEVPLFVVAQNLASNAVTLSVR